MKGFLAKLEKASENPELIPEMGEIIIIFRLMGLLNVKCFIEAQVLAGSGSSILSGANVPSWAEWALGSLGSKFYHKSAAAPKPTTAGKSGEETPRPTGVSVAHTAVLSTNEKLSDKVDQASTEGWDDLDEDNWGDMDVSSHSQFSSVDFFF